MSGLNLANFKKLKEDKKTVTMGHPAGHSITILKSKLSGIQKEQIKRLPIHAADGAMMVNSPDGTEDASDQNNDQVTEPASSSPKTLGDQLGPMVQKMTNDLPTNVVSGMLTKGATPPGNDVLLASNNTEDAINQYNRETGNKDKASSVPDMNRSQQPSEDQGLGAMDAYNKELTAIRQKQSAEAGLARDQATIEQRHQAELQEAQDSWGKTSNAMQADISNALNDVKNNHIDPSHYLDHNNPGGIGGTAARISTAIGLLLGGFTGGFNGSGVNPAAQWLTGQIDRDIDAQKAAGANKANVFNGYLEKYKNTAAAEQMARAAQLGIYASKIRESAAKAGGALAQSNGNLLAAELESKMIPLITNAHLVTQLSQFNGGGTGNAPSGSESQYKVALGAAQQINPDLYKDQQSKYVPSVGVASHPVAQPDAERLTNLNALIPLIDRAITDQSNYGMLGARFSMHPIKNPADASSDREALQVSLNKLTGLNRLNDREYQNYGAQIGDIGGMNAGGTLETLKRLKEQATMDKNSAIKSMGITKFSDASEPSGLNQQQENNLNIFLRNNPTVDHGTAIATLRKKGLL